MLKSRVVPINLRTGKPYKRIPKKNTNVQYAVLGPRGGISILRKEPQKFYKSDLTGLNESIKNTQGKNFVVYEQKTRQVKITKKGKKVYQTKLTYAQPRRKQQPFLYIKGKKQRALDIGFKTGNYQKSRQMRKLLIAQPNKAVPIHLILEGKTIKDALDGLQVNVNIADMLKHGQGLYYSMIIKIVQPDGSVIKIPVNSSHKVDGFEKFPQDRSYMILPGEKKRSIAMRNPIHSVDSPGLIANLQSKMSTSIRYAIKSVGYRFTSLTVLKKFSNQDKQVYLINGTHVKTLKQLTKKYAVHIYVRFEQF